MSKLNKLINKNNNIVFSICRYHCHIATYLGVVVDGKKSINCFPLTLNTQCTALVVLIKFYCWDLTEAALLKKAERERGVKRKLERHIEEEMQDDYVLDLKKNYDLPDEYKYDVIPEFMEGVNIADYIDPDIFKVSLLFPSLPI
jgi:NOGCT (NUC087) domain.